MVLTPLTVFMVMFVVQMGLFFHARTVLNAAAQDGARAAQLENATVADGEAAAWQTLAGSGNLVTVTAMSVEITPIEVNVVIDADVVSLVPFWSGSTTARSSGPNERFRSEDER